MEKKLLKVLETSDDWQLRLEEWWVNENEKTEILAAYTIGGDYIGNLDDLITLTGKFGVVPELSKPDHNTCSIGFNKNEQKWYGWSHRALFGFGIGHITKKGDCQTTSGYTDEYIKDHPEELEKLIKVGFVTKDLDDCKKVAIAFAASVS